MSRLILNLGCGKKLMPNAVNVDITDYPGIDQVVDLSKFPWPWPNDYADEIHLSHILEHFSDQKQFIYECWCMLKPGGLLHISGPHASCISSVGCLGHYRTYSYDTFRQYLSEPWYMFKKPLFKTVHQQLNWWYEETSAEGNIGPVMAKMLEFVSWIITPLINISPRVFENLWWPLVGGAREVIWKGVKL